MTLMHYYGYRSLGIRKDGKRLDVVSAKGGTLGAKYLDTDWRTPRVRAGNRAVANPTLVTPITLEPKVYR